MFFYLAFGAASIFISGLSLLYGTQVYSFAAIPAICLLLLIRRPRQWFLRPDFLESTSGISVISTALRVRDVICSAFRSIG